MNRRIHHRQSLNCAHRKMKSDNRRNDQKPPTRERAAPRNSHPLQTGIKAFLDDPTSQKLLHDLNISAESLKANLPHRFTVYKPLLLLPATAFQAPPDWGTFCAALSPDQRNALYASIAKSASSLGVSHVAMNTPITLTDTQGRENRMRSPTGLIPLYGDFGGPCLCTDEDAQPGAEDLRNAFWVHAKHNNVITQIWAPLYTMYSRGNISEKSRILGCGPSPHAFDGLDEQSLQGQSVADTSVVDMYAGIGYFTFCYLKRGVKRVWGWELNGWSVEGLRRGCEANKWGCKVVRILNDGRLDTTVEDLVKTLTDQDRVVIFHGDNRFAGDILRNIQKLMERQGTWHPVRHVNLGLLPSSQPSWDNACRALDLRHGGWIHVHENVDVQQIDKKKEEILMELAGLRGRVHDEHGVNQDPTISCVHVERVKTYAPGVMHCVFDMKLSGLDDTRI